MIAPVDIGDTLAGKYEIERFLAKGGMGVVVVARHLQLDKQVAIKFMLPHLLRAGVEPGALERFVREGRAAVRLRGENVARVIDVDSLPDGMPYMVMEYLEGQDLSHHIQKHGPLPLAESVDYVLQACVAMAEAHLCGIVHRDLKPSNLFLTRRPDGSALIKVLDFGISKLYEDPDGERTQTAVTMGSPSYMAPEQAQSARDADVRSDIWSMGVVLYECTSKQLPYGRQASTAGILAQLIYEQPRPLADVAPNLPAAFCKVVDICLKKEPAERYQTIGELASALLPFSSAVGRQAAASIHAIIGGAPGSGGAPASRPDAGHDEDVARPAKPDDLLEDLHRADTDLASRPPGMTLAAPAAVPAPRPATPPAPKSGGPGILELDAAAMAQVEPLALGLDPRDPVVRQEATPYKREPQGGRFSPWRVWLTTDRLVVLATAMVLAVLTALILISGTKPVWPVGWIDALNALVHRLGYEIAGPLGRYWRILAGPAFQIAIPFALAQVLVRLGRRRTASVFTWWLGANAVHIARAMADATSQPLMPITGDLHPWNHWFGVWRVYEQADTIAVVVHWAGAALMIGVLLAMLYRTPRRPSLLDRRSLSGRRD
jgi:eukaryotic-like serine/threonine-protein kinase